MESEDDQALPIAEKEHHRDNMKEFAALTALIVEPHSGMRGSMHNMLNLCDITKIDHAVSSGTAIRQLKTSPMILSCANMISAKGRMASSCWKTCGTIN